MSLAQTAAVLPVHEYARAREPELKAIAQELQALARSASESGAAGGGGKRTFQKLPRHLRRRAMSHNLHRIPRNIRRRAAREYHEKAPAGGTQTTPPLSHRHVTPDEQKRRLKKKRRARRYLRRPARLQLLPAIWHAKRFKMAARWGWKVALRRSDRGMRASYRSAASTGPSAPSARSSAATRTPARPPRPARPSTARARARATLCC
eukprot:m51a1_g12109 putative ribonucleases p mrp protein subunit pop1-like (207) ;mRNA; r:367-1355